LNHGFPIKGDNPLHYFSLVDSLASSYGREFVGKHLSSLDVEF